MEMENNDITLPEKEIPEEKIKKVISEYSKMDIGELRNLIKEMGIDQIINFDNASKKDLIGFMELTLRGYNKSIREYNNSQKEIKSNSEINQVSIKLQTKVSSFNYKWLENEAERTATNVSAVVGMLLADAIANKQKEQRLIINK